MASKTQSFSLQFIGSLMILGILLLTSSILAQDNDGLPDSLTPIPQATEIVESSGSGTCQLTTNVDYTIELCIEMPMNESVITNAQTVSLSVEVTGDNPGIAKFGAYLNNERILTSYVPNFSFDLPSQYFADGMYDFSVDVVMRDEVISEPVHIDLIFDNGNADQPVNSNTFDIHIPDKTSDQPISVVAVGDGASGERPEVTDLIGTLDPDLFLYLGDVYDDGFIAEFYNWYGSGSNLFSQFNSITNPTVGNHEYEDGVAKGYFDYWDNVPHYYSYDIGEWHFITLDSNINYEGLEPGTEQFDWLFNDLLSHSSGCTLAYFHHPLYNIGPQKVTDRVVVLQSLLVDFGVDVILTGHDHNYQRWYALDGQGKLDPNGMTHFVVGAGGHGVAEFVTSDERVASAYDTQNAFGVLQLNLNTDGLEYEYINTDGRILDSGAVGCDNNSDTISPTVPSNLQGMLNTNNFPELSWDASIDNAGVSEYNIFRDDTLIATVAFGQLTFVDTNVDLNTTYTYHVQAIDTATNESPMSNLVQITTLDTLLIELVPVGDAYVNQSSSSRNYGDNMFLRTDISPETYSYVRFDVPNFAGQLVSAYLETYSNSSSNAGYTINLTDDSWSEYTLTYDNAPPIGEAIRESGEIIADTLTRVDITSAISPATPLNIVYTAGADSAIRLASRESATPPKLFLEVHANDD